MPAGLASNLLMPSGAFIVAVLVSFVGFGLLVVWPLVEMVVRRQWGYLLAVVVLGPIGGLLWLLVGRRETADRPRRSDGSEMRVTHSV